MKSENTNYLSRLDHLRFIAAILVIVTHIRGGIRWDGDYSFLSLVKLWVENGSSGVSLFLVLTGFLFTLISGCGSKEIKYSGYIYNRVLRIFPLVIFLVFVVLCVSRATSSPLDIFRLLTLQLNTGHPWTGWGHNFYPSGPIWTIAVEFQFYLIFPFLVLFLNQYGVKYILSLVLLMVLVRFNITTLTSGDMYYNLYHTIVGRLDQFLIGMLLAYGWKKNVFSYLRNIYISFFVVVFCVSALTLLFTYPKTTIAYSSISFTLEGVLWGMIGLCYISVNFSFPKGGDKVLSKLGEVSFSIYLLHLPISQMLNKALDFGKVISLTDLAIQFSIKIPIIVIISMFTYAVIEKPFMSLRVKYVRDKYTLNNEEIVVFKKNNRSNNTMSAKS